MSSAETLLAQAVSAVQKGDFRTAADRFERAGQTLAAVRPSDAVAAYESAARLWLMLDDPRRARANVARAVKLEPDSPRVLKVNAEVTDKTGDPHARRTAWVAVADIGDRELRFDANIALAKIARELDEHQVAESHFVAALEELGPELEAQRPDLLIEIAICRGVQQNWASSEQALTAAEALVSAEDPDNFRARINGQRGSNAYGQGDYDRALKLAEAAREGAVDHNDVMSYLAASTLIAAIYERTDRLVDAYDTYIRARESLGQLLGEQAKGLVQPAVTLFEERLGPEKFKQIWDQWVAMRRTAKQN